MTMNKDDGSRSSLGLLGSMFCSFAFFLKQFICVLNVSNIIRKKTRICRQTPCTLCYVPCIQFWRIDNYLRPARDLSAVIQPKKKIYF
jgi:hypothetical protein